MKKDKPAGIQLLIRAIVRDPDGKVLSDTGQKPAKSFVIQFLQFINALFMSINGSEKTVDGGTGWIYYGPESSETFERLDAPINNEFYGIVVGTGDTAEDNEDYKLDVQLTEGVGVGNITHAAMTVGTAAVVGPNVDIELTRAFTNNTGAAITVKETGIIALTTTTPAAHFLIVRDVLGAPVEVSDKCSLTIIYTIRTTV